MKTGFRYIAAISCVSLLALYLACASRDIGGDAVSKARQANALDCILLSEHSDEAGPMLFPHYLHYGPKSAGMSEIACGKCHFCNGSARRKPEQACRNCHSPHDGADNKPKAPSL